MAPKSPKVASRDYTETQPGPQSGPPPIAFIRTTEVIHREELIFGDGTSTFGELLDSQISAAIQEGRQLLRVELEISEDHWEQMVAPDR